jgi:hypothetical protein
VTGHGSGQRGAGFVKVQVNRAGPPASTIQGWTSMDLRLVAYAGDCIVRGHVQLTASRLTDQLNAAPDLVIEGATLEALDDGRTVDVGLMTVPHEELFLIEVVGPRGDRERRVQTVKQRLVADLGIYRVSHTLHTPPTMDPMAWLRRRGRFVPTTECEVELTISGLPARRRVDVLLINRDQVLSVRPLAVTSLPETFGHDLDVVRSTRA